MLCGSNFDLQNGRVSDWMEAPTQPVPFAPPAAAANSAAAAEYRVSIGSVLGQYSQWP